MQPGFVARAQDRRPTGRRTLFERHPRRRRRPRPPATAGPRSWSSRRVG